MEDLKDVCYRQIKDNFYYGLFGDFQLVVDKNTGCFNATKLCNNGGKKFKHLQLIGGRNQRKVFRKCLLCQSS